MDPYNSPNRVADVIQNSATKTCFLGFCGKEILKKKRREKWPASEFHFHEKC